ncbi:hypothetical protein BC939DRAFT_456992 [Gamsiella multidivaricata]|uniref:uncharacterized protein n=1 Tax=Gamsiella multidivaricata TaxID=101098 RepID=UPI00221EEC90|nr:uncharacterized protein BC939DRAFT_456992 [Gamsiella multidivaricata]KAI7820804.1 hypothetical protein BC939DRAFT_456992 [Gamsiella multidivaricata]
MKTTRIGLKTLKTSLTATMLLSNTTISATSSDVTHGRLRMHPPQGYPSHPVVFILMPRRYRLRVNSGPRTRNWC